MILTTSWDDGHPLDSRLADMLLKYGLPATFYVPCRNSEGRPVLANAELRAISARFEVGGHTLDHVRLTRLAHCEAERQVRSGKDELEQRIGKRLIGFCYPGGMYNSLVTSIVEKAGFKYARTIVNFSTALGSSPYELPTTMHFHPLSRGIHIRNFFRFRSWEHRLPSFLIAMGSQAPRERAQRLADYSSVRESYFHLWGHSWEIEHLNLWGELELAFRHLSALSKSATAVDNAGVVRLLSSNPD